MSTDPKTKRCAVCGVPCIDLAVNGATLCDPHFDGWLARPARNPNVGGAVEMAAYVADEQAKARRSA